MYDLNADGRDEVIHFFIDPHKPADPGRMSNVVVQIRNGATGRVLREAAPLRITQRAGQGANWMHQRILVANLRGNDHPRDFVVKLGDTVVAFTDELRVLWTYRIPWNEYSRCSAYIPANVCGDSREEVLLYNPWDRHVWIYTPAPLKKNAYSGYRPGPRQYNARLMD